jgi:hypothetical protein
LDTPLESAVRDQIAAAVAEIAEHRAVIDQAIGMLILLYGVDDVTALDMLRVRSQNTNIKLRALAVACQGDGTTGLPCAWDRVVPVVGRALMVTDGVVAGQSDGVGRAGFRCWGFWRCR